VKKKLGERYKMVDIGIVNRILRREAQYDEDTGVTYLSQLQYAK